MLSDIWNAPLHDFPIRDEILRQWLPESEWLDVLEVGPGSGYTAYRLAQRAKSVTLLETASEAAADLEATFRLHKNVHCVCADVCRRDLRDVLPRRFDVAFGLDVLEYVADPAASLRNLCDLLRQGGVLLLTWPNIPPPLGDGVTYYRDRGELDKVLKSAGFSQWSVFPVRMRTYAGAVFRVFHEWPLRLHRRWRPADGAMRPQTYDRTWAFRHRRRTLAFKTLLHVYWLFVGCAMRVGGPLFAVEDADPEIVGKQIVLCAKR